MVRKWLAAMAVVGLAVSTAQRPGREDRDRQRLEGDGRRRPELDSLLRRRRRTATSARTTTRTSRGRWPPQNDYVRAIDFTQPASRATWATYAVPVTGGRAALAQGTPQTQQIITPENTAWAQQLEIWITPWGFLKGAAANNATVRAQTVGGTALSGGDLELRRSSRRADSRTGVVGYINGQNLVERVQTWLENPIFGDMLVEAEYSALSRQQRPEVPGADRAEARRLADLRGVHPRRARQSRRTSRR